MEINRILLTGGAGYIGSHVALDLLNAGYKICIVDDFSNGARVALDRVKALAGLDFEVHDLDICETNKLSRVLGGFKPEAVVHLAGLKAVGDSIKQPLLYYDKNVSGTISLLKAMNINECKSIIFSSSATVYAEQVSAIDELQSLKPVNAYGRSKYFNEEIIRDWTMTDAVKSSVILRYFNPLGAHQSGEIGESPNQQPTNLMPIITQVGVRSRPCLYIYGNDYPSKDGTAIRDYIHVSDLATGHLAALTYASNHSGYDVFNLGTGVGSSVLELINAFELTTGVKIPYEITSRRFGDVYFSVASAEKAQLMLRWKPKFSISEMCRDAWRWQSLHPKGYAK